MIAFSLLLITISSLTSVALAISNQGKSDIAHQQCLNGLQAAAVESGNCTWNDLVQFNNVIYIRETQGIKAAKDACFALMSSPTCQGICVGAIHCFDF
jgi:hypothetical protein